MSCVTASSTASGRGACLIQAGPGRFGRAMRLALAALLLVLATLPAAAVEPGEILADPALEVRARKLSAELRCLVCQNQSIDDSNAPLAKDLRLLVRERLQAGETDRQVMDYIVARYGEFVLLRPPFGWNTLLLWLTPALVLAFAVWLVVRMRRAVAETPAQPALTADEQARLARILDTDKTGTQSS